MHKNLLRMKSILFFYILNFFNISATELIIQAQDDQTDKNLIKISIPQIMEDGPVGDKLSVITEDSIKAIKDYNDNFLEYYVDKKGNIAPYLLIKELLSETRQWPPTSAHVLISDFNGKKEDTSLAVKKDKQGIFFVQYKEWTYDIASTNGSSLNYPLKLEPRDIEGNLLLSYSIDQMPFFNDVSTFGTVWSVFDMYGRDIEWLNNEDVRLRWENKGKVRIFPHMTLQQFNALYPTENYQNFFRNAFYDYKPGEEAPHILCFFPVSLGSKEYTSQFFSIVSHEAGHNVLNILRPELRQSSSHDLGAFHETFGDMTALFATLKLPELRVRILEATKGNLHYSSFLSVIGKSIVDRDATQCTTLSVVPSCEEHDLSEKLTRALYGTFADYFNALREDQTKNLDSLLEKTATDFRSIFVKATVNSKLTSFVDFGRSLREEAEKGTLLSYLVHTNFLRQGIDLTDVFLTKQVCLLQNYTSVQSGLGCATRTIQQLTQKTNDESTDDITDLLNSALLNENLVNGTPHLGYRYRNQHIFY